MPLNARHAVLSAACSHCREFKRTTLKQIKKQYGAWMEFKEYDVLHQPVYLQALVELTRQKGRTHPAMVPSVYLEGQLMVGSEITIEKIDQLLKKYLPCREYKI